MQATNWRDFLAELKGGPVIPGTPGETNWKQHVKEISTAGQIVSLTEENWNYWLEVLPPRWMSGAHFCFAEGEEPFRFFWVTKEGQFFARQLNAEETLEFCALGGIRAPAIDGPPTPTNAQEEFIIRHLHPTLGECCGEGGA